MQIKSIPSIPTSTSVNKTGPDQRSGDPSAHDDSKEKKKETAPAATAHSEETPIAVRDELPDQHVDSETVAKLLKSTPAPTPPRKNPYASRQKTAPTPTEIRTPPPKKE